MKRDVELVEGHFYHVFNKSIAGFQIFMNKNEYLRMINTIRYYQVEDVPVSLSQFLSLREVQWQGFNESLFLLQGEGKKLVEIVAYCLMPTHVHLILKQLKENGISTFMRLILNSYSRYFNVKHQRNGPLWQGRFKNVLVESDEQLYHLTRYIHLNPVTARLVNKPEQWRHSSFLEYVRQTDTKICQFEDVLEITSKSYKEFVDNQIHYQQQLAIIKSLILE